MAPDQTPRNALVVCVSSHVPTSIKHVYMFVLFFSCIKKRAVLSFIVKYER